jgi:hypothetical protein
MKFKYYITDLYDGAVKGTDDTELAKEAAECEDLYVVEADTGTWLLADGLSHQVQIYGAQE